MKFTVDQEVLNKVMSYLGQKPFVEVHELIKLIQESAKPIEESKEE